MPLVGPHTTFHYIDYLYCIKHDYTTLFCYHLIETLTIFSRQIPNAPALTGFGDDNVLRYVLGDRLRLATSMVAVTVQLGLALVIQDGVEMMVVEVVRRVGLALTVLSFK